ncbi:hypothetical protein DFS33DRAFT_852548 [Desarmillaria ectypa]|nr:hypothetical protein DFS33DRAFT_852548 [Desarmillaria ectypa]
MRTVAAGQSLALHQLARFGSVPHVIRLGSAALCDTSLAISLCYLLHQKRTSYKQTDEIVNHLMMFSISTGLLTSFASVAGLITYLVAPKTWVYLALCFLISRHKAEESPAMPQFCSRIIPRALLAREKPPTQLDIFIATETISDASKDGSLECQGSMPNVSCSMSLNHY